LKDKRFGRTCSLKKQAFPIQLFHPLKYQKTKKSVEGEEEEGGRE
jgi:hypothetical protein